MKTMAPFKQQLSMKTPEGKFDICACPDIKKEFWKQRNKAKTDRVTGVSQIKPTKLDALKINQNGEIWDFLVIRCLEIWIKVQK